MLGVRQQRAKLVLLRLHCSFGEAHTNFKWSLQPPALSEFIAAAHEKSVKALPKGFLVLALFVGYNFTDINK